MSKREENLQEMKRRWAHALSCVFGTPPPDHAEWRSLDQIVATLDTLGKNSDHSNHMFFPSGGGLDCISASPGLEVNTVDLYVSERHAYRARPGRLLFRKTTDIAQAFFVLQTESLEPSDLYEYDGEARQDAVTELPSGEQFDRSTWDDGVIGLDENGNEILKPTDANLISRVFDGQILIVGKASKYNLAGDTYDGRHADVDPDQIENWIENDAF